MSDEPQYMVIRRFNNLEENFSAEGIFTLVIDKGAKHLPEDEIIALHKFFLAKPRCPKREVALAEIREFLFQQYPFLKNIEKEFPFPVDGDVTREQVESIKQWGLKIVERYKQEIEAGPAPPPRERLM